jgi:hypothetical protein
MHILSLILRFYHQDPRILPATLMAAIVPCAVIPDECQAREEFASPRNPNAGRCLSHPCTADDPA